jgi:hypothetical protein
MATNNYDCAGRRFRLEEASGMRAGSAVRYLPHELFVLGFHPLRTRVPTIRTTSVRGGSDSETLRRASRHASGGYR